VCVCVCMFICVCVCMHLCVYTYIRIPLLDGEAQGNYVYSSNLSLFMYSCSYFDSYVCVFICICTYLREMCMGTEGISLLDGEAQGNYLY